MSLSLIKSNETSKAWKIIHKLLKKISLYEYQTCGHMAYSSIEKVFLTAAMICYDRRAF